MDIGQLIPLGVAIIALCGSAYAVRDAGRARRLATEVTLIQRALDALDAAHLALQPPDSLASDDVCGHVMFRFSAMGSVIDRWGYLLSPKELRSLGERVEELRVALGYISVQSLDEGWLDPVPAINTFPAFANEVNAVWEELRKELGRARTLVGSQLRAHYQTRRVAG